MRRGTAARPAARPQLTERLYAAANRNGWTIGARWIHNYGQRLELSFGRHDAEGMWVLVVVQLTRSGKAVRWASREPPFGGHAVAITKTEVLAWLEEER